jgi:hypothetical protein
VLCDEVKKLTVEAGNDGVFTAAQPAGTPNDSLEDRLGVDRRSADHAENLTRRGLLI